ncbi:apses-domain-containing protein [Aulographum hederae CBS 113979]|uniref:Transcription factor SWI6 n=1 Tax=Aulographum hederae CBS 113979 TaxID=1176131 RepID=A0A6G1HH87_9PEZI|nr:apses-domain-containing protein [Aulographum hederae CBS 113979]
MNYRSFDGNGHAMSNSPQIYTAVYSGVSVYEMELNGVAVMRRRSDSWLNATQILKVAGVDKGKRTKVLEKEILTGDHEKVQGGYGKYQGTWINYRRGREFCRQYGVEDLLRPLLEYDVSADGSGVPGHGMETPTKEQAMAANRKRFYTSGLEGRSNSQNANGTFFSNISATASNAIAAMNKVARLQSPAPRPGSSAQRRTAPGPQRSSQSMIGSQESFRGGSQPSLVSERSFTGQPQQDSAYATQSGQIQPGEQVEFRTEEPPRKRMRPSSQEESLSQPNGGDISMRDGTPTEPNDSFLYHQAAQMMSTAEGDVPVALPSLPHPADKKTEEKQNLILDLFNNPNHTDLTQHSAILHLSGQDFDIPLDQTANTALHWAATLARVPLMRLLIAKGANMFRGNVAGQTPLMAAVQVNNSLDHSCFPEMLEILGPLIELRDAQNRTILHHIAVASGIKGRAASSKYYLEALLEFLVRGTTANPHSAMDGSKPIGLMRFMSEMVNARDKGGNTALNLVARIGNKSIIQQLLEVQADPTIRNYRGVKAIDFGVGTENMSLTQQQQAIQVQPPEDVANNAPTSKIEEASRELIPTISNLLSETNASFELELRHAQERIDRATLAIRDLSAHQQSESAKLEALKRRQRNRTQRTQRLSNLRRATEDLRQTLLRSGAVTDPTRLRGAREVELGQADKTGGWEVSIDDLRTGGHPANGADGLPSGGNASPWTLTPTIIKARIAAYEANNGRLHVRAQTLKSKSVELESLYRRVVALCTGVEEQNVERMLAALVQALGVAPAENRPVEVGRVREFLRKVDGVVGP